MKKFVVVVSGLIRRYGHDSHDGSEVDTVEAETMSEAKEIVLGWFDKNEGDMDAYLLAIANGTWCEEKSRFRPRDIEQVDIYEVVSSATLCEEIKEIEKQAVRGQKQRKIAKLEEELKRAKKEAAQ